MSVRVTRPCLWQRLTLLDVKENLREGHPHLVAAAVYVGMQDVPPVLAHVAEIGEAAPHVPGNGPPVRASRGP